MPRWVSGNGSYSNILTRVDVELVDTCGSEVRNRRMEKTLKLRIPRYDQARAPPVAVTRLGTYCRQVKITVTSLLDLYAQTF